MKTLYPDCKHGLKKLGTILEMLQWKAANSVLDKGFEELLGIVKKMLPEGNELHLTTYEAKNVVCPFALDVQKIHACPNNCILYRDEYDNWMPVLSVMQSGIRLGKMILVMSMGSLPIKKVPAKVCGIFR